MPWTEITADWDRAIRNTHATGGTIYGYHPHVTYTTTASTMTNTVWNVNTTTATHNTTTWLLNYNTPERVDEYRQRLLEERLWQGHDVMDEGGSPAAVRQRQTAEELHESRHAQMIEHRREREARDQRQYEAEQRAMVSLREFLGDARYLFWAERRMLVVRGSAGGIFVLRPGTITNITQIREDRMTVRRLCAHPELEVRDDQGRLLGSLPMDDVIIGQVLALTTDEVGFCRIANVTRATRDDVQGIGAAEWREWLAIEQREDNPDIINGGGRQVVIDLNDERTHHDDERLRRQRVAAEQRHALAG